MKKKKDKHRNENFLKNANSKAETMEFGRKMTNLLCSPARLSISNQKATQIKRAPKRKVPKKKNLFRRRKHWNLAEKR